MGRLIRHRRRWDGGRSRLVCDSHTRISSLMAGQVSRWWLIFVLRWRINYFGSSLFLVAHNWSSCCLVNYIGSSIFLWNNRPEGCVNNFRSPIFICIRSTRVNNFWSQVFLFFRSWCRVNVNHFRPSIRIVIRPRCRVVFRLGAISLLIGIRFRSGGRIVNIPLLLHLARRRISCFKLVVCRPGVRLRQTILSRWQSLAEFGRRNSGEIQHRLFFFIERGRIDSNGSVLIFSSRRDYARSRGFLHPELYYRIWNLALSQPIQLLVFFRFVLFESFLRFFDRCKWLRRIRLGLR